MKRHATERGPEPDKTLCGLPIAESQTLRGRPIVALTIDNAHPDCKRCLRAIAARLRVVSP